MDPIIETQMETRKSHRCRVKWWIVLLLGVCCIGIYTATVSFKSPKHPHFMAKGDSSEVFTLKWTQNMDILDEEIALKDPPLVDIKKGVDVRNSKVYLPVNTSFEVGDTIKVRIDLFNGYGNQLHRGGDQLRVRIFEDLLGASAAGYVLDHENGSYTAVLRCLWAGTPDILVYIAYTREAVRALYNIRDKLPATRTIQIVYKNNESKRCHALMNAFSQSTRLCNMTSYNGNMSWYCEAPSGKTTCNSTYYSKPLNQKLPVTEAEETLFKRNGEHLFPVINILVKESSTQSNQLKKQTTCYLFNRTKLWFKPSPIGHFMHNTWHTEHCKMTSADRFSQCLRNKHVLLYGDSTVRQWFQSLRNRFKCELKSQAWDQAKWKMDSKAFCPSMNLTLEWIAHALPGNLFNKTKRNSIAEHMLEFAENKNAIFVIHLLCHLSAYHHDVFRDRIAHISKSVNSILKINKDAKILIKGGHTFRDFRQVSDYYGYVYRQITTEEFRGLYDKVVYLDNKDMTIAREVQPNHPDKTVVTEMVNQMLSYVCR